MAKPADWTNGVEAILYQSCAACGRPQYFRRGFCAACGAVDDEWHSLCPLCGRFDALAWRVPEHAGTTPQALVDLALLPGSAAPLLERTAAKSAAVGYLTNRPGVTSLTLLSVHWAERIVAIKSSKAFA